MTIDECPTGLVTGRSIELVGQFHRLRHLAAAGVEVSLGDLPGWYADALTVMQVEWLKVQNARAEAESKAASGAGATEPPDED